MKRLALIGAGNFGYRIAYHALADNHYQPVGFFDDNINKNSQQYGLPVLGTIEDIQNSFEQGLFDFLMISIGYCHFDLRADLFNYFKEHIPFGTIVHSSSYVDKSCTIESGVFVHPGCVLDVNTKISHNVVIGSGCVISHDSKIGPHSMLSPSVNIAGFVEIGQKVNLGVGTTVIDHIKIADYVRTGGGAVVIDNLDLRGLYIGVPAHFKKTK
jgi:sugar O-acyltransferase (sialic acid O-acetyltransferase NeuD family)